MSLDTTKPHANLTAAIQAGLEGWAAVEEKTVAALPAHERTEHVRRWFRENTDKAADYIAQVIAMEMAEPH